ncbi:hypothetical protein [Oerskovia turbata]
MTTEKNPYEPDDARDAVAPDDATIETAVPSEDDDRGAEDSVSDDRDEISEGTTQVDDPDATQVIETHPADAHDPDATQVIETAAASDDALADEHFRTEPTQALPVAEPTLTLPVTAPAPAPTASSWESAPTHTQAYPVQDAPVEPEPVGAPAPAPTPAPAVDPAAQWNTTAQQRAQAASAVAEDPREHGLRVSTVVWGFVIVAVGAGILALALGATYDLDVALIALLSVAGLVLVVSSIVSSGRRSARERARRASR